MARQVKLKKGQDFSFGSRPTNGSSTYPWDEWFASAERTGEVLLLERSVVDSDGNVTEKRDYDVLTNAMVPKIHTAARRRYKVVQVSRRNVDGERLNDALIIRSRDMDPEERELEEIQRVEDRKRTKDRRDARKAKEESTTA